MVIKKPMDFSTLLTNIDEHKYVTVNEFMSDADLIWQNALEYNPDSDPMGEHEHCFLKARSDSQFIQVTYIQEPGM